MYDIYIYIVRLKRVNSAPPPPTTFRYMYRHVLPTSEYLTHYALLLWVEVGQPCSKIVTGGGKHIRVMARIPDIGTQVFIPVSEGWGARFMIVFRIHTSFKFISTHKLPVVVEFSMQTCKLKQALRKKTPPPPLPPDCQRHCTATLFKAVAITLILQRDSFKIQNFWIMPPNILM